MKTKRLTMIIVGIIMLVIGIGAIVLATNLINNFFKKNKTYIETKGIIVDYAIKGGHDSNPYVDWL